MSNEKPVELTESEQQQTDHDDLADLIHEAVTAGGDHHIEYDLAYAIAGCIVRSEWLKGREIAAEQAGREDNALHEMCYASGSRALEAREAAARREALLEAAEHFTARANAAHRDDLHMVCDTWDMAASDLRALAEPDRIEEHRAEEGAMSGNPILRALASVVAARGVAEQERALLAALAEPERDEESL